MANQMEQIPPAADSFHLFPVLADELRLLIWEHTWPASRLIEAAYFDLPDDQSEEEEDSGDIINLRLAGSLSTMMKLDLGTRLVDAEPVERCPAPIALQVCHQSRMHTLSRYRVMTSLAGPFYYSPQIDVIWFSIDVADDYRMNMPVLEHYHKPELDTFETVLVEQYEWPDPPSQDPHRPHEVENILKCISHLGGLKRIQILWEGPGLGGDDSMELDDDEEAEDPPAVADRLKRMFPAIVEQGIFTASKIEVLGPDGKLY